MGEMRLTAWIPAYAGMTGNEMLERIQVTHYQRQRFDLPRRWCDNG